MQQKLVRDIDKKCPPVATGTDVLRLRVANASMLSVGIGSALRHLRECCIGGVLRGGGLLGWLLFGRNLHDFRCLDCRENQGGCALNDFQALGQKCRVSVVKMDVVGLMLGTT